MAEDDSYRPKLLFLENTGSRAFYTNAATTDTSVLEGSLVGGGYGPDQARFEEAAMQECVATLPTPGVEIPSPEEVGDDPSNQPYQAAFQACPDVDLLQAWLEAAGEDLDYGTLAAAIDGLELVVPGDPDTRTYGPAPPATANPAAYLFAWDESIQEYVLQTSDRASTRAGYGGCLTANSVRLLHGHEGEAMGKIGSKDPAYADAYVDVDEWRDEPVRHRYVHGGFTGTDARFSMYFPPAERYEGRFFQPVLPMSGIETAASLGVLYGIAGSVGFAADSGAYLVESNLGRLNPFPGDDWTVAGYRASAAVARYSRGLAADMYGDHRPYGYVFGGSGGALKTVSCFENVPDVWDGAVPFVMASSVAMPNVFSAQAHAMRLLWDRFPAIVDALEPGGSGDMYAGLTAEQRAALAEVTRMGFPPRAWFDVERLARGYTAVWSTLADNLLRLDPTYFEDFWTVPGYLGAHPPASLEQARIQHKTTVTGVVFAEEAAALGLPHADGDGPGHPHRRHPGGGPAGGGARGQPDGRHAADRRRPGGRPGDAHRRRAGRAGAHRRGRGPLRGRGRAGRGPRGGGRQLGVPGLPDLPPPPGRPRLPRLGPVHRGRPPDLPAAAERDRPVLRPPGLGLDQDRPVRREDDRGPDPDGRGRVPVAGRLVPRQGRGGARRRVARRPLPALVRRPRHAHRRRPAARDGHARHVAGPQDPHGQLPGRAAAGAARRRRLGRAWPGSAGEHRASTWSAARCACRRPPRPAGASRPWST